MAKKNTTSVRKTQQSTLDLAVPVSDRVSIRQVLLVETHAIRKPRIETLPKNVTINAHVDARALRDSNALEVLARFSLRGLAKGGDDNVVLRIEAAFVLIYEVPSFDGLQPPNIKAFGEMNGIYNAWPYWREYVQSVTVRMGLPPFTVPVFRLSASKASR